MADVAAATGGGALFVICDLPSAATADESELGAETESAARNDADLLSNDAADLDMGDGVRFNCCCCGLSFRRPASDCCAAVAVAVVLLRLFDAATAAAKESESDEEGDLTLMLSADEGRLSCVDCDAFGLVTCCAVAVCENESTEEEER